AVNARLLESDEPGDPGADAFPSLAREHNAASHSPVEMGDGRSALKPAAFHLIDVVYDGVGVLDRKPRRALVRRRFGLGWPNTGNHGGRDGRPDEDREGPPLAHGMEEP